MLLQTKHQKQDVGIHHGPWYIQELSSAPLRQYVYFLPRCFAVGFVSR